MSSRLSSVSLSTTRANIEWAIIVYSFDEMEGGDMIEMEIQPEMIGAMLSGCTRSSQRSPYRLVR
jgi:hypothetical protein